MTTWWPLDGARISSRRALIGSASSKVMLLKLPAVSEEPLHVARDQVDLQVDLRAGREAPERRDLSVCGIRFDLEHIALDPFTVRLTPSMQIDPLRAT